MKSEDVQKSYADDVSIPRSGGCFCLVEANFLHCTCNQKHYLDLGSFASAVRNLCSHSSYFANGNQTSRIAKYRLFSPPKELIIDYFACLIGPAPEAVTNEIFTRTGKIASYKLCKDITVDLDTIGSNSWEVEGHTFTVTVRDSVEDYTQLMKEIFDFDLLKKLISGDGDQQPFKFVANAMNGGGLYSFNREL